MKKALAAALAAVFLLAGCSFSGDDDDARDKAQKETIIKGDSLEKRNLMQRLQREERADHIGYVYLSSFGKPVGYYVIRGKVSSAGSQIAPEDDMAWTCRGGHGCSPLVVDGAQDDGTYGASDPGIFFFTTDGVMVETNYDYQYSDEPLDLPEFTKIGEKKQ